MAHDTLSSAIEGSRFDYPPVPDVCTNPYSTSDAIDAYNHNFAPALDSRTDSKPFSHPYYSNQPMPSSTATVPFPSYSNHGVYGRVPETYPSMPSPVSHTGYGTPTSSEFADYTIAPDNTSNIRYDPYPTPKRKRPRGTTGTVICDQCDKRFTVRTSLNRHKRICRGRNPALGPRKSNETKDADIMSGDSFNTLPAGEAGFARSEGQSQILRQNRNFHTTSVTSIIGSYLPY